MKLKWFLSSFFKIVFLIFLLPSFVFADIILSEIMYDPDGTDSGYEWIEIKNTSNYVENLEGWKFCEGSDSTVCHSIREDDNPNFNIEGNSFGIITDDRDKFLEKNNFNGLVLESTGFSLLNSSGEKLELKNSDGNIVDFVTYNPESGGIAGDSLSLFVDVWKNGEATPGLENIEKNNSSDSNNSNSDGGSSDSSSSSDNEVIPKTYVEITDVVRGKKRVKAEINEIPVVIAGATVRISGRAYGLTDNEIHSAEYFWSMGDGGKKHGREIFYKYDYPGEYIVSLTTKVGHFTGTDRKKIKVIEPEIIISSVDFEKNLIEIENQSNNILNLENWIISVDGDQFIIPTDTFIDKKSKIIFSNKIMGFRKFKKNFKILLLFPDKKRVFTYKEGVKEKEVAKKVVKKQEKSGDFLTVKVKRIYPDFKINIKGVEASIVENAFYEKKVKPEKDTKNTASIFNAFNNSQGDKNNVLILSDNEDFLSDNLIHLIFIGLLFMIVLVIIFSKIFFEKNIENEDFIDIENEAKKYKISEIE